MERQARPRLRQYPKLGTLTIADGDRHVINRGGDFARVNKADQEFTLLLDDEDNIAGQDTEYKLASGDKFKTVTVYNTSGSDLTFQMEIGQGDVSRNKISISDGIEVRTDDASPLKTDDDGTQAKIDLLIAELQKPKVDLSNATRYEASGTTTAIATALENENGAIIHSFDYHRDGGTECTIELDGNSMFSISSNSEMSSTLIENYKIPSGVAIDLVSTNGAWTGVAWVEVL